MKILIITPIYLPNSQPISFLLADFSKHLVSMGMDVFIITANEKPASFRQIILGSSKIESIDGIIVHRLAATNKRTNNIITKAITTFIFAAKVLIAAGVGSKPDLIYVPVPPNSNGIVAMILSWRFGCKYIINVQDIYPDTIINLGLVKSKIFVKLLRTLELAMYSSAAGVTVIGESFKENLLAKKILPPIFVAPNWVRTNEYIVETSHSDEFRREHAIRLDDFVVLYAGTFGRIHGTEVLIDVAFKMQIYKNLIFVFVGHGIDFEKCRQKMFRKEIKNCVFIPYVSRDKIAIVQSISNMSVVTLLPKMGYSSVPSKLLGYMAAAKPVIALTDSDSDTAKMVIDANCGFIVKPDSVEKVVNVIKYGMDNLMTIQQMGINGLKYINRNRNVDIINKGLFDFLKSV